MSDQQKLTIPKDWNRVYENGKLVRIFPPIECGDNRISGCSFYDCYIDPRLTQEDQPNAE